MPICKTFLAFVLAGITLTSQANAAFETFEGGSAIDPGTVEGQLMLPDDDGSHPIVIMLHGCGGLLNKHERWARLFADWSYASLRVDSFGPRGIAEIRTDILRPAPHHRSQRCPALPAEPGGHRECSGRGHRLVTLRAAAEPGSMRDDLKDAILGSVAIYPYYARDSQPYRSPVLILIGEADNWTPADLCVALTDRVPESSAPVELVVYEDATHSYDCRICDGTCYGHRLVCDEAAYLDSVERVRDFLDTATGVNQEENDRGTG